VSVAPSGRLPSADQVRARLDAIYASGSVRGESGGEVDLAEGLPAAQTRAIADLATAEHVQRTLEVGIGLGLGTLALSSALLAVGSDDPRHTVVDPTDFRDHAGARTVRDAGVESIVERVLEPSQLALPRLVTEGRSYDLALVDGGHRFDDVMLDLVFTDRLLKPGAVLIADDAWLPAVRAALAFMESNLAYALEPAALPTGFRWRRGLLGRRRFSGRTAVLRKPLDPPERPWNHFVPFGP
jgi:predicted O-methyltransferase YrrM